MLNGLRFRLRALLRRNVVESELDQELRFHFEQEMEPAPIYDCREFLWMNIFSSLEAIQ
jgi:hypothetical protein